MYCEKGGNPGQKTVFKTISVSKAIVITLIHCDKAAFQVQPRSKDRVSYMRKISPKLKNHQYIICTISVIWVK